MRPELSTTEDGIAYRDLNGNGRMDPYEDPRLPVEGRVDDLVGRLSLEEKVGLMFQTVIEAGADGTVLEHPGAISKSPTSEVVLNPFRISTRTTSPPFAVTTSWPTTCSRV